MRRPITISLSPNTEPDDVAIAWQSLLMPWKWWDTSVIPKIEKQISELFVENPLREAENIPEAVLTSSGRSAIYHTLKALEIGTDDEVILQAFTCLAVPAATKWTGAKPVFADVIEETYNLNPAEVERKITSKTKAIIVQHTFGIPAEIEKLREIADKNNLILIEDLAHGLGGRVGGTPLGTFGDVAILSFGRDKTISSLFSGAVVTKNTRLANNIRENQDKLKLPSLYWIKQQLLHPIVMSIAVPLYFVGGLGKVILVAAQKLGLLSKAMTQREKKGEKPYFVERKFSPALAPLLQNQLSKLRKFSEHRRRVTYLYKDAGLLNSGLEKYLDEAAWLRVPYRVNDAQKSLKILREKKMLLGDWYLTPVTPCALNNQEISGYEEGSCPVAEKLSKTTINLPTYPLLLQSDVEEIMAAIRSL